MQIPCFPRKKTTRSVTAPGDGKRLRLEARRWQKLRYLIRNARNTHSQFMQAWSSALKEQQSMLRERFVKFRAKNTKRASILVAQLQPRKADRMKVSDWCNFKLQHFGANANVYVHSCEQGSFNELLQWSTNLAPNRWPQKPLVYYKQCLLHDIILFFVLKRTKPHGSEKAPLESDSMDFVTGASDDSRSLIYYKSNPRLKMQSGYDHTTRSKKS